MSENFTFVAVDKEAMWLIDFQIEHEQCVYKCKAATGGVFSYTFTPTSIGTTVEITCNMCKATKNVTNFDQW